MVKTVSVYLDSGITYVSGVVNGVNYTFTLIADNTWGADVEASDDNIYRLVLTAIDNRGNVTTISTVLYYGLYLVRDRSRQDVSRYLELKAKDFSDMTESEKMEWLSDLKGAYNATDLSRVDGAIDYLVERLRENGYYTEGISTYRLWSVDRIPRVTELARYLNNVRIMRNAFATLPTTPNVPDDMRHFTHREANDIEQILYDVDMLITNMVNAWFYADDVFSGEV